MMKSLASRPIVRRPSALNSTTSRVEPRKTETQGRPLMRAERVHCACESTVDCVASTSRGVVVSNACSPVHVCSTFSFMQVPLALNGRHKTFPHSFRWPLALALALPFLTSAFLSTPQSFSTGCVNVDCGATYDDDPCFELSVSFCVHSTICALLGVSPRDRRLCVLP